jgi:hypothetical protein
MLESERPGEVWIRNAVENLKRWQELKHYSENM